MDGDFFQLLRRVQKEERNKSSLARVDNDFYKKLYSYIRALERSVSSNPFDTRQSNLLSNAQRIATAICEQRESKISQAAINNIYRSFHLFKKDNPQFDLLDTTPLNLTPEEETLYFSLMDALKTHRYNISLDKFGEDKTNSGGHLGDEENYEDEDDSNQYGDEILESRVNPGVVSEEEFFGEADNSPKSALSNESEISAEPAVSSESEMSESSVSNGSDVMDGFSGEVISQEDNESDEVLDRLNQIKNATVIEDEVYEPIEKQINNQAKVVPKVPLENNLNIGDEKLEDESKDSASDSVDSPNKHSADSDYSAQDSVNSPSAQESIKPVSDSSKPRSKPMHDKPRRSSSTLDFDSIFANPDSQFADIDTMAHDYEADFANIESNSGFAQPNEADLMFSTKPRPKKESPIKAPKKDLDLGKVEPSQVGSDIDQNDSKPKADSSKSIKSIAKKEEIENTAVVILNDMESIVGVDEKVYGPFSANDVVILPNITAQILVDNNKAGLIDL